MPSYPVFRGPPLSSRKNLIPGIYITIEQTKIYDLIVIGDGPAGLSMAGALARQVHTVLVLDSGEFRNERSKHMHNVAGWDHVDPAVFQAKAREDIGRRYATIEFKSNKVVEVRKADEIFEVTDQAGLLYTGRKLGFARGVQDLMDAELEGFAECWGRVQDSAFL
ncbi:Thioredoxin reductase gliT [Paramyrothecium foliicola]|nr:Thioredoxin reductase gliT [Paramyrothecium foliicola]